MSIRIETARQKLISSYGVDVDKYSTDEMAHRLSDNLEGIFSFNFTVVFPILITGIISVLSTVALWFTYKSPVFCILFFIFSIPVFFLGAGALGLSKGADNLLNGVSFILGFATNITKDICKIRSSHNAGSVDSKDLTLLVLYGIVLPIVEKIALKRFLGGILYFVIEKAVNIGFRSITTDTTADITDITDINDITDADDTDDTIDSVDTDESSRRNNENSLFKISDKVKNISKHALKSSISFLKVLGIIFIVIGLILIGILFLVHSII